MSIAKYRDFLYIPPPRCEHRLPAISTPRQRSTLVTTDEPPLIHPCHSEPVVYVTVQSIGLHIANPLQYRAEYFPCSQIHRAF